PCLDPALLAREVPVHRGGGPAVAMVCLDFPAAAHRAVHNRRDHRRGSRRTLLAATAARGLLSAAFRLRIATGGQPGNGVRCADLLRDGAVRLAQFWNPLPVLAPLSVLPPEGGLMKVILFANTDWYLFN